MAVFRLTAVFFTLALQHGFLVYVCQSCSQPYGWQMPTLVDRILEAESVLYGTVKNNYPDQSYYWAYTVELEVHCILKGPKTPLVINITDKGLCAVSVFEVNRIYIALADVEGGTDQSPLKLSVRQGMTSANIDPTPENLNEIRKACGLNPVTRPEGASSTIECPVSVPNCQSQPSTKEQPSKPVKRSVADEPVNAHNNPGAEQKTEKEPDDKSPEAQQRST